MGNPKTGAQPAISTWATTPVALHGGRSVVVPTIDAGVGGLCVTPYVPGPIGTWGAFGPLAPPAFMVTHQASGRGIVRAPSCERARAVRRALLCIPGAEWGRPVHEVAHLGPVALEVCRAVLGVGG